ncbi:putative disease resistance protein RGA4 isoform X1 [Zingiber officinale]|uniref:putative disease resistance protein RGA4 isoform X1 n=1 Tax=Zingiber officinale TaxID=94328 RepID=UPI001C4D58D2|nr:putative disease resistance protein RGA4 isoform X1 [Zingiber officinale]XP_042449397.1 putative disease resistance protein RGA4 isoform X1 [Zingiber officinale]XP_042449398.1 putative disease resistance protein RGA4 isoform X1 [Zingiber officinale]XP_042449399.1 putative disease resistance protein RGA4 isoform X1 [Zingiber officinale]XP_042449400.1 putative disease resistance protein RGA4 isoform X1 [Zingiber officinale]
MDVVSPILDRARAKVIDKLIDKVSTYVQDQYYWKANLQEELQNLKRLLPQIQAVVGYAEDKLTMYESHNPALIKWLWQFRDDIDEAEEVLDELEYRELEKKSDGDKSRLSTIIDPYFRAAKRFLKSDDDVLERLRTCVENLKTSASYVETFRALVTPTSGIGTGQMQQEQESLTLSNQSRITSSLPGLSFKGREEEKGKIIQYLLGEESEIQTSQNVHCLPLVAMGGMGKTALAQQVFDHFEKEKKGHFNVKIWVCDSLPNLNASNLMKKILEYSTGQSESGPSELMPVKLKDKLHSKRFLLVLDDAWDDKNHTEWEKLCIPLLHGQKGSWILLTTRLESVAKMVSKIIKGGTMKPMTLQGLPKDECRSLLYEHAFVDQDPNGFPLLKKIGEEIVEKLHGVPLLAKSIGGALNNKLEADHWTSISRSELWKMPQDLNNYEFIPALTLSYKMLPPRLKQCFSYCSIFPQDYTFKKQKLVCIWVAAGLIYSDGSEEGSDEDIANYCFDMLCNKSFFDVHTNNWSAFHQDIAPYALEVIFYTMHDMLNGLSRHVSRYECCRIVHDTPSYICDYNAIRHISISITSIDAQLGDLANMVCKFKNLRTLRIEQYYGDSQKLDDFIRDACKSPRRIRVLTIRPYKYFESISDFVKLRFLEITALPPSVSISKFYFLQVLTGYRGILAKDTSKLRNLRHLYGVPENALFSVAEVGKLTCLQELCFTVGIEPGYRIDELMNMDNLRQLSIAKLSNVHRLEEANNVDLVSKSHLTSLELNWYKPDLDEASSNLGHDQQEVLAALQPPPTIRKLIIREYKGGRPAPWMNTQSLSRLESLELYNCTNLEELPPLWKLPCLKFIKLSDMKVIRSLGCHSSDMMDKQFSVLEKLEFRDLPLLEEWNGADDYQWFPRLKRFEIEKCPKLKKIPDLPLSIENLCMKKLGLEALPRFYKCSNGSRTFEGFQQLMSLEFLEMDDYSEIVDIGSIGEEDGNFLPSELKKLKLKILNKHEDLASYLRGLTLLTELSLSRLQGMTSLPLTNELEHLTTLRSLYICDCEDLTSPGGVYIIKSLKHLYMYNCPKFLTAEVESQQLLKDKTRKHAASSSSIFDHSTSNKAASTLPSSLESLTFSTSKISQESLGCCLQGLTSLKSLDISKCNHLVSLPNRDYLHNLTALQTLWIANCKELCKLESLTALISLRELYIYNCPKLHTTTLSTVQNPAATTEQSATKIKKGTLLSLEKIQIDNIFYLPILPIPEKLKTLYIKKEITCFPSEIEEWLLQCQESLENLCLEKMPHLQSLPVILESFSSLKFLSISSAPELKSLPRMPASLEQLTIHGCSAKLEKRCQKNIGPDWPNIEHIPHIKITAVKEDKAKFLQDVLFS